MTAADDHNERLVRWIADLGGKVTVAQFMQGALYDPRHGYYASRVAEVGAAGDFSTTATVHPALGRALARWALGCRRELLPAGGWHLIEIGAGGGQLAADVMRSLGLLGRRGLTYHVVEVSPGLRKTQQRRLRGPRVRWHASVAEALDAADGAALVFSNELVDAFPCHQIVRHRGEWREIYLTVRDGRPRELLGDFSDPRIASDLCSIPASVGEPREEQRFEIHLAYLDWLRGWLPRLRRGALLTIDYGDAADRLARRGRGGTLRGYHRHLRVTGRAVYQNFGGQDLTADVNFTDLQEWGARGGLVNRSLQTQRDFILGWLPGLRRRGERDEALSFVLDPGGAGEAFRALEQVRPA